MRSNNFSNSNSNDISTIKEGRCGSEMEGKVPKKKKEGEKKGGEEEEEEDGLGRVEEVEKDEEGK